MSIEDQFAAAITANSKNETFKAITLLNDLLTKEPKFVPGWNLRGMVLATLGHPFDAVMNYDRAIELAPEVAEFYSNRGGAHADNGNFKAALKDYQRSIFRQPNAAMPYRNRGNAQRRMGDIVGSIDSYRHAVSLAPDDAEAHLGLSFSLLETSQFEEGWKEFEWRWKSEQMVPKGTKGPEWTWEGERAVDHTKDGLMIYGEQGYGDVLQFMRYLGLVKHRWWGKVYVAVKLPLVRVVKSLPGVDGVLVVGEKLPPNITKSVAMGSLPRILGTQAGFDVKPPYMRADPHLASIWRERLQVLKPGLLVGICWAGMNRVGSPIASSIDQRRSLELSAFALLARVPGVSWVSLQKGPPADQVRTPPSGMRVGDWSDDFHDFADTAALINNLDLVITVDTAIVHVAGALGVPTWMLSRFDGCWRWMGDRADSPWYPNMTQFRQKVDGAWPEVMERVQRSLLDWSVSKRQAAA